MEEEFKEELTITLDKPISTLNGQESWQSFTLREPIFAEVDEFYKEARKTNENFAMAKMISAISGVNVMALQKIPIRQFREAQAYLLDFLNYFPTKEPGGKGSPT